MFKISDHIELVDNFIKLLVEGEGEKVLSDDSCDKFMKEAYRAFFERREALLKEYLTAHKHDRMFSGYTISYTGENGEATTIIGSPFRPTGFLYSFPIRESSERFHHSARHWGLEFTKKYRRLLNLRADARLIHFFLMTTNDLFGEGFLGMIGGRLNRISFTDNSIYASLEEELFSILDTERPRLTDCRHYIRAYYEFTKKQVSTHNTHFFEVVTPRGLTFGHSAFDEYVAFYTAVGEILLFKELSNAYVSLTTMENQYLTNGWLLSSMNVGTITCDFKSKVAFSREVRFKHLDVAAEAESVLLKLRGIVDIRSLKYGFIPMLDL